MALGKAKWWEYLIPGWNTFRAFHDVIASAAQIDRQAEETGHYVDSDGMYDAYNDHGLDQEGNIDINPADPTSSASNVINYDPNKSAMENMLGYAQANNSASAYNDYLQTAHNTEMSNTAISRAIADAEANGISKYQLFQSGNAAASTPSSGSSLATSYENAMNRRESWNEKEMAAVTSMITKIVTTTISSALKFMK